MIREGLYEKVLLEPARNGNNRLLVVSAYATPAMVYRHFSDLPPETSVNLIVGMVAANGIPEAYHREFVKIAKRDYPDRFECRYVLMNAPVHAKAYIWESMGVPLLSFIGSANYSQVGFSARQREVLVENNPNQSRDYYDRVLKDALICLQGGIEAKLRFVSSSKWPYNEELYGRTERRMAKEAVPTDYRSVRLPLLMGDGQIHERAGLNWGQRPGRERNQAYIPVPISVAKSGFFPPRGQHFTVITDDNETYDAVIAQANDKAIETPLDNSILGRYFRRRIGVAPDNFIQAQDLVSYGRTDVGFRMLNPESYFMDFSIQNG